jgi:phosphatidylserine/phosphatidylglycerophosphate/cardiolipin synthase-like enzyme
MRFKSAPRNGYQVFAVSGVNTVSFGIQASATARRKLLGFAVERIDPVENERYIMPGFKVFHSRIPNPTPDLVVSTWDFPVQSFVWDDFTGKPDREYEYLFHPIKGTAKNLDRLTPIHIKVRTEPLFTTREHDVFFNRGVASSQAYKRKFGNLAPDKQPTPAKQKAALQWLTRDLDEALLRFITKARSGDTLLCCFYEFRYRPVAEALVAAIGRGVNVRLIVDAKRNATVDAHGVLGPNFPRDDNLELLAAVQFPAANLTLREAKKSDIQHNKFMVLVKKGTQPAEVWTGSTNISLGGLSGQTNVGHWVRNPAVAEQYQQYWQLLSGDPGSAEGDNLATARKKNADYRTAVAALHPIPATVATIAPGITTVFSPRTGLAMLDLYGSLVDSATGCSCITLAFGVNKVFKTLLSDNTPASQIVFLLLEKRDKPNPQSNEAFVALNAANNVYEAWGSFIRDPVYQWARETNAAILKLNEHVAYIHSKFLLMDPLGPDPIVVTGSANFSEPSTNANDENMLLIRGAPRVADIYFTEFNRLFNHYYFRSVTEALAETDRPNDTDASLFLAESDVWLTKYAPGKLRAKRLQLYTSMKGAVTL